MDSSFAARVAASAAKTIFLNGNLARLEIANVLAYGFNFESNSSYEAQHIDLQNLKSGGSKLDLISQLLWHQQPTDELRETVEVLFDSFPTEFTFWKGWYGSLLEGRPMDWNLQREVALIDDFVWNAGYRAVAEEIARIEARFLTQQAPQAETIELNPETNRFRAVPISVTNPKLLAATLSQVSDALDDTLTLPSNGLTDRSRETRVIRRVVGRYGKDPQRVEMDFTSVAIGLRRQIHETEDLPPTEDNLALLGAVEDAVRGVRETHPEVAENRAILAKATLKELSEEDKQVLADAGPMLTEISEGNLAEDFAEDIPALTGASSDWVPVPAVEGVTRETDRIGGATARTASRSAKIWQRLDVSTENLEWMVKGKAVQAAALTVLLKDVIQIFLRIFGVI